MLASMTSLAENTESIMGGKGSKVKDNGARVSNVNREDDGSRLLETETAVESRVDLDDLDEEKHKDGNINSVSNGEAGLVGNAVQNGITVVDEKIEEKDKKLEDSDHGFRVGDIVWTKIKSHPWWPGQIYDSKDASEFALKYRQEGRLLVASFGDGSCSWCLPSQLIPFVENFKEMSTYSSSWRFGKAIQGAVDEVGRLVESHMICKCVTLNRPVVENAGLKAGVLALQVDISRLSVSHYGPVEILSKVTHFAKTVDVASVLDLAVLKSSLSGFYRAQGGGYQLPIYHEPVYIEGMEDKNNDEMTVDLKEDECLASMSEKIYHKQKQKSVAELMADNSNKRLKKRKRSTVKEDEDVGTKKHKHGEVEEEDSKNKMDVSTPADITNDVDCDQNEFDVAALEVSSPRERKKSKYLSPPYTDPRWLIGCPSKKMESKSLKIAKAARVGEQAKKASGDMCGSSPRSKIVDDGCDDDKLTIRQLKGLGKVSVSTTPPVSDVNNVKKCKRRKRKSTPSRLQDQENESKPKTPKAGETEEKPDTSKSKKASESSLALSRLILTFRLGYPLPSKEEILRLFDKYGSLNEKETNVMTDIHTVQIAYTKDCDAATAFKSSMKERPFGIENVNYCLQYGSKAHGTFLLPVKWTSEKTESSDDVIFDIQAIRQKVEIMTAILEYYHSKFSSEDKASLKDDIKHLKESVETATEKVQLVADHHLNESSEYLC